MPTVLIGRDPTGPESAASLWKAGIACGSLGTRNSRQVVTGR